MTDAGPSRPGRAGVRSDYRAGRSPAGTVPVMAPWSPVALPPRFAAARRTRLVGRRYELGVLESVWERVVQGARPGPADRRRTRRGQDPAGRRGRGRPARAGRRGAGGHGDEGRRVAYQPFAEMLDHLFLTSEAGTLEAAR